MKKTILSLLFICLTAAAALAQPKSQVISDVIYTMQDFEADLNYINEDKDYGAEALQGMGHTYGSPDYFIYNGKQMDSFRQWLEGYCFRQLGGEYVEHTFMILQKTFMKVEEKEKNDRRYRFDALLTRKSDGTVNDEKTVTFIVEWKGNSQYVTILEIRGEWYEEHQRADKETVRAESPGETMKKTRTDDGLGDFLSGPYFYFGVLIVVVILMFIFLPIEWCEWLVPIVLLAGILLYAWLFERGTGQVDTEMLSKYDKYETVDSLKVVRVCKDNKWGLIDYEGDILLPLEYQAIGSFCENMTWIMKDDKFGYVNAEGVVKVPPQYDGGRAFHNGQTLVLTQKDRWHTGKIIDTDGKVIRELPYHDIKSFKNLKIGYIRDKDWKEISPPVYNMVEDFQQGYVRVEKDNKKGILDSLGNVVIPCEYEYVHITGGDRINLTRRFEEQEALVDLKGEWVVKFGRFNRIDELSENRMAVKDGHKWGFIDRDGKVVIPLKYNRTHTFSDGLAVVRIGKNHGCIDTDGNTVIPLMYEEIGAFQQGLMTAQKNGKWGFINRENKTVIPFKYKIALTFGRNGYKEGTTLVADENGYGIIDNQGNTVIPCQYSYLLWEEQFYRARKNRKWGLLDENGKILHDFIYDDLDIQGTQVTATKGKQKITLNIPQS